MPGTRTPEFAMFQGRRPDVSGDIAIEVEELLH